MSKCLRGYILVASIPFSFVSQLPCTVPVESEHVQTVVAQRRTNAGQICPLSSLLAFAASLWCGGKQEEEKKLVYTVMVGLCRDIV